MPRINSSGYSGQKQPMRLLHAPIQLKSHANFMVAMAAHLPHQQTLPIDDLTLHCERPKYQLRFN